MRPFNFKLISRVLTSLVIVGFVCLWNPGTAAASAIYNFNLPANGAISALSIQLTEPALLPADGLIVLALTDPLVTGLSFPTSGFNPAASVIGVQITPTTTLIGLSLLDTSNSPLLFTTNYPADFFMFTRTPTSTGTFLSFSGNVVSSRTLATPTPTGSLTVTAPVPEPSTWFLLGSSLFCIAGLYRIRRQGI